MHPLLMSSGFDPFQIAIIVIFVIGGFLKWLWENWMQNRAAPRQVPPPTAEEQRLRDDAWRRQTGQLRPPPIPQPASSPVSSPWSEVRKAWAEIKEAARQSQMPSRPTQRHRVAQVPQASPPPAKALPPPAEFAKTTSIPSSAASPPVVMRAPSGALLLSLQNLRHESALMRQAILMREVLGPPKALQTSTDPSI